MARQDIANMLTGMGGGSTRPNPNMSSSDWRMAFGAEQAQIDKIYEEIRKGGGTATQGGTGGLWEVLADWIT